MTKTLNEQLCEICGIEPRYGLYINVGDLDPDYRLVTNERKYRLIADYRYYTSEEELKNLEPKYLPDFTLPKNFVKLLKIYLKHKYYMLFNVNENVFDTLLLQSIKTAKFTNEKKFKEEILQADWDWS